MKRIFAVFKLKLFIIVPFFLLQTDKQQGSLCCWKMLPCSKKKFLIQKKKKNEKTKSNINLLSFYLYSFYTFYITVIINIRTTTTTKKYNEKEKITSSNYYILAKKRTKIKVWYKYCYFNIWFIYFIIQTFFENSI